MPTPPSESARAGKKLRSAEKTWPAFTWAGELCSLPWLGRFYQHEAAQESCSTTHTSFPCHLPAAPVVNSYAQSSSRQVLWLPEFCLEFYPGFFHKTSFMAGTFFNISQPLWGQLTLNPASQNVWTRMQFSQEPEVEKAPRLTKFSEKEVPAHFLHLLGQENHAL